MDIEKVPIVQSQKQITIHYSSIRKKKHISPTPNRINGMKFVRYWEVGISIEISRRY